MLKHPAVPDSFCFTGINNKYRSENYDKAKHDLDNLLDFSLNMPQLLI